MGCSWYGYAGEYNQAEEGYLLIPEYAHEWVGAKVLKIERAGDYAEIVMTESPDPKKDCLNGHMLVGIFSQLNDGEPVSVTFEECFFKEGEFPYDNKVLENLRYNGINLECYGEPLDCGIKIVREPNMSYEDCDAISVSTQMHLIYDDNGNVIGDADDEDDWDLDDEDEMSL